MRARRGTTLTLLAAAAVWPLLASAARAAQLPVGGGARTKHTVTLLRDGRLLVAGGTDGTLPLSDCRLFDPASGTFSPADAMDSARFGHAAVALADGRVLVTGGEGALGLRSDGEIYDPVSGLWTAVPGMSGARALHTSTLLADGRVLVAFGSGNGISKTDLFHPSTTTFSPGPTVTAGFDRQSHTATLLPSGKVLLAGGQSGTTYLSNALLFDPTLDLLSAAGNTMSTPRALHGAVLRADGTVLLVAGLTTGAAAVGSSELFDPQALSGAGSFSALPGGGLSVPRYAFALFSRADGSEIVAGGYAAPGAALASVERFIAGPAPTCSPSCWAQESPVETPRAFAPAGLLPDGRRLLVAGENAGAALSSAVATDRSLALVGGVGAFPALNTPRTGHTVTLLPDGRLLSAGGLDAGGTPLSSCEIFNPFVAAWGAAPAMSQPRSGHTATLLGNGLVLVAGGGTDSEIFDPAANAWSAVAGASGRRDHTATLLADGRVLLVGDNPASDSCLLFDPWQRTWTAAAPLPVGRFGHTACLLHDGTVLVAGGESAPGAALQTCYRYVPGGDSWTSVGAMLASRAYHTAHVLPDGRALVVGGAAGASYRDTAELYTIGAAWTAKGTIASARARHGGSLLPNGWVLLAKGEGPAGELDTVELFDPMDGSPLASFSSGSPRRGARAVPMCDATSPLVRVAVVGGGSAASAACEAYVGPSFAGGQPPAVNVQPPPLAPGGTVSLTGTGFSGWSEQTGGFSSLASAGNQPILWLTSGEGGRLFRPARLSWTPQAPQAVAAAEAGFQIPQRPPLAYGDHLLRVAVGGACSNCVHLALPMPSPTRTASASSTPTASRTASATRSPTATNSRTPSPTATPTTSSSVTPAATIPYCSQLDPAAPGWALDGLWHEENGGTDNLCRQVNSAPNALHYGKQTGVVCDYETGVANTGSAAAPEVHIPAGASNVAVSFLCWYQIEPGAGLTYDQRWVDVSVDGGAFVPLGSPTPVVGDDLLAWHAHSIPLTAYAGHNVRVRFRFNTGDANYNTFNGWHVDDVCLGAPFSPTPSRSGTPTPTATETPTRSATATMSGTPSGTPTRTASATGSRTGTGTRTGTATGTPTSSFSVSATFSHTPGPSVTATRSDTRTQSGTATHSASPTGTGTDTDTPSATASASGTATETESVNPTLSRTATETGTPTSNPSFSTTPTATGTGSGTPTATDSGTATLSATETATASASASDTGTDTPSATGTPSPSGTETSSASATETDSGTATESATASASASGTPTETATASASGTRTGTESDTRTPSATWTSSATPRSADTATPTAVPSGTETGTRTQTSTATATESATETSTATAPSSPTVSPTNTPDFTNPQTFKSAFPPGTVSPGATVVYSLNFYNAPSGSAAIGLVVTDVLPAEMAYLSNTGGAAYNAGTHTVTATLPSLPAGASWTFSITVQVGPGVQNGQVVCNSATLSAVGMSPVSVGPACNPIFVATWTATSTATTTASATSSDTATSTWTGTTTGTRTPTQSATSSASSTWTPTACVTATASVTSTSTVTAIAAPLVTFPNPLRTGPGGGVTIGYRLDGAGDVSLAVFDFVGDIVWRRTIARGSPGAEAGNNLVRWDGNNGRGERVGTGMYVLELRVDGRRIARRTIGIAP